MTGTSHGNVFDYFNTFSAVLDWWFSSKPECQKLSYLVSRVLGGGAKSKRSICCVIFGKST